MNIKNKSQVYNCLEEGNILYNSNYQYLGTVSNQKKLLNNSNYYGAVAIRDNENKLKWITGFITHCFKRGFIVSNLEYLEN